MGKVLITNSLPSEPSAKRQEFVKIPRKVKFIETPERCRWSGWARWSWHWYLQWRQWLSRSKKYIKLSSEMFHVMRWRDCHVEALVSLKINYMSLLPHFFDWGSNWRMSENRIIYDSNYWNFHERARTVFFWWRVSNCLTWCFIYHQSFSSSKRKILAILPSLNLLVYCQGLRVSWVAFHAWGSFTTELPQTCYVTAFSPRDEIAETNVER